jgi:hypothetical protein
MMKRISLMTAVWTVGWLPIVFGILLIGIKDVMEQLAV